MNIKIGKRAYYAIALELERVRKEYEIATKNKDEPYRTEMRARLQGINFVLDQQHINVSIQKSRDEAINLKK